MKISYGITVHNELEELTKLLDFLNNNIREEDEIVIQYDEGGVTPEVLEFLKIKKQIHGYTVIGFPLNKDFASYKNNLKKHCTKDYIFQIDADEIPHEVMIGYLPQVLADNPVDIIFVPRVNTVSGLSQEHIEKWRWNVNEKGWVNWPDYQTRIYRNTEDVTWMNKVHEKITGYDTFSNFPAEEHWALYHPKEINRQEKQNEFYETI
jgi:glycosyltransferase involved in cell wall biosynthesis